jgi:hypothetical protein
MSEKRLSRSQRARREALWGALGGALWGLVLWGWFGEGTPSALWSWVVLTALLGALVLHHGEWMCG